MDGAAAKPIIDGVAKKAPKSRAGMGKCKAGSNGKWKRGMVLFHNDNSSLNGTAWPNQRKKERESSTEQCWAGAICQ